MMTERLVRADSPLNGTRGNFIGHVCQVQSRSGQIIHRIAERGRFCGMKRKRGNRRNPRVDWLPFLSTYRTMCLAPDASFFRVLEEIRELRLGA